MLDYTLTKNDLKMLNKITKTNLYVDIMNIESDCIDGLNRQRFFIYNNKTIKDVTSIIYKLFKLEYDRYDNTSPIIMKYREYSIYTNKSNKYILAYVNSYIEIILDVKNVELFAIKL